MKKVIALTAALGLSAIGMACGGTEANVNVNANKAANVTNVAPASSPVTMASPMNTNAMPSNGTNSMGSNSMNSNMKPANGMTTNSNMKPANAMASPMGTKKP